MAEWWPFDRSRVDEWKRTWTDIVSVSSAAAASIGLPQPGTLPGDPFALLVDAARAWLSGKQRTFRFSGHDLNVYIRPGTRLTFVAAPVLCEAFVSASFASRWLATVSPRLELTMVEGIPQVTVAGMPWVRLDVDTGAEGQSICVRLRAVYLLDWRLSLPSPAFYLPVPDLPAGFMLTSVEPAPGGFVVRGLFSEWQQSLSRDDIERLLAGMRSGQDRIDI
jgi:hypothetical protein